MLHQAILDAWLADVGQPTAPSDPFRNPVGHAIRDALPVLLDVVLGRVPVIEVRAPLEHLMRIRAVQDCTPAQAVAFLFALKPLVRDRMGLDAATEDRIDRLALLAFDQYLRCREQAHVIQLRELQRRAQWNERLRA